MSNRTQYENIPRWTHAPNIDKLDWKKGGGICKRKNMTNAQKKYLPHRSICQAGLGKYFFVFTQNIAAEVFGITDKNWVVLGRIRGLGFVELIFYSSFAWANRVFEKSLTETVHI